jgi:hypothetical protein
MLRPQDNVDGQNERSEAGRDFKRHVNVGEQEWKMREH